MSTNPEVMNHITYKILGHAPPPFRPLPIDVVRRVEPVSDAASLNVVFDVRLSLGLRIETAEENIQFVEKRAADNIQHTLYKEVVGDLRELEIAFMERSVDFELREMIAKLVDKYRP